jgi:hypothetical protein
MAQSKETQAWLEDLRKTGQLSDEQFKLLGGVFDTDAVDKFVKESVLRQSDYSRAQNEVRATQEAVAKAQLELQQKEQQLESFRGELTSWREGAQGEYNKALQEREKASNRLATALNRVQSVAAKWGIPADDLKDLFEEGQTVTNQNTNATGGINLEELEKRFLTAEQMKKLAQEAGFQDILAQADIQDFTEEYRDLHGSAPRGVRAAVEEAIRAGKPVRTFLEEKFKMGEARKAAEEAAIQKRIDAAVQAKTMEILSDPHRVQPGMQGRDDLHGSPVLRDGGIPAPKDENSGSGVSAAMAAFASRKYKGGVVHE